MTQQFYLANYASQVDVECCNDERPHIEWLANPVGILLLSRDEGHIAALLRAAYEDHPLLDEDDNDKPFEEWTPDWQTDGWQEMTNHHNGKVRGAQIWWSPDLEVRVELRTIDPLEPMGGPA